jgi:hypothetical protein
MNPLHPLTLLLAAAQEPAGSQRSLQHRCLLGCLPLQHWLQLRQQLYSRVDVHDFAGNFWHYLEVRT